MTVAEQIVEHVRHLPEAAQAKVLGLVRNLEEELARQEDRAWSGFSLRQACRGMESEEDIYTDNDLKEVFPKS